MDKPSISNHNTTNRLLVIVTVLLIAVIALLLFIFLTPESKKRMYQARFQQQWYRYKLKIVKEPIKETYLCMQTETNPDWLRWRDDATERENKCLLLSPNPYKKCMNEAKVNTPQAPQMVIEVEKTCEKVVGSEEWLWFFGKKLIRL